MVNSVAQRDYPVAAGGVLPDSVVAITILLNLLGFDVLYVFIGPAVHPPDATRDPSPPRFLTLLFIIFRWIGAGPGLFFLVIYHAVALAAPPDRAR